LFVACGDHVLLKPRTRPKSGGGGGTSLKENFTENMQKTEALKYMGRKSETDVMVQRSDVGCSYYLGIGYVV
jgi:hypothetical protein